MATVIGYRELARNFVVRNLKLKYKGSLLGFLWSFLTPLLMMVVYTLVFRWIIRIEVEWPFAVFLLTGLLPWIFFATSLTLAANSLIESANLIKKVYFPREIIPLAAVCFCENIVYFGLQSINKYEVFIGHDFSAELE